MFTAWLDQSGGQSLVYAQRLILMAWWRRLAQSRASASPRVRYVRQRSIVATARAARTSRTTPWHYGSVGLKQVDAGGAVLAWVERRRSDEAGTVDPFGVGGGDHPQKFDVGDSTP